jgi:hypothetical protein
MDKANGAVDRSNDMKHMKDIQVPRRRFLQQLIVLGGTTSVGAVALTSGDLVAAATPATPRPEEAISKGYRLTDHIRTYYEKAQI